MNYFSTGVEAQQMYEERLQQAAERRRANKIIAAQRFGSQPGLLVRAGEIMVAFGERLKRRGNMTYTYDKQLQP